MDIHTLALLVPEPAGSARNPLIGALPFVIMFALFWIMIIVPQRRQAKAHLAMVQALSKGDQVVTAGGLIGTITAVRDDQIEVRTGTSTVVVERARITRKVDAAGGTGQAGLMPLLKIELLGSEVLRRRQVDVPPPGPELDRLVADMFDTMYEARGIGLAAPQVGLSQRLVVVDVHEDGHEPMALLNPVVAEFGSVVERYEEGCLSIPGVSAHVERPVTCVVDALDQRGNPVRIQADGMLARCLQHEIDHLDGVLFIDRLSPIKRNMLVKKYRKLAREGWRDA